MLVVVGVSCCNVGGGGVSCCNVGGGGGLML